MPATNHNDASSSSTTATTTASLSSQESTSSSSVSSSSAFDPDTFLLNHLTQTSALEDLHANLLSSLQRTGWTERVRNLSLELLRAGKCHHFDDVVEAVVALAEGRPLPAFSSNDHHDKNNMNSHSNGDARDTESEQFFENIDVRIPSSVVEQGVKQLKDALRPVIELEDDGPGEHDLDDRQNDNSTTIHNSKKPDKKNLKLSATSNNNSANKPDKGGGPGTSKSPEKVTKNGDTSKHLSSAGAGGAGGLKKPSKDGAAAKKSQKAAGKS